MDRKTKRHIYLIMLLAFLINIVVFIIDYFNVFSIMGLNVKNINLDFLSLIFGNTIVVSLFVITYYIVDTRGIKKEKNQLMTAYMTLIGIYERCKDMVDIFSQEDLRERSVKKCDGEKMANEDKAHMHFLNFPFENEMIIYDFAKEGVLSKAVFKQYITIKKCYQKYINVSIIFYDNYSVFIPVESDISNKLSIAIAELKQSVEDDTESKK